MRLVIALLLLGLSYSSLCAAEFKVPILLYHRLGPAVVDSMTLTTPVFESQLQYLKSNGFTVIPLRTLVDHLRGTDKSPLPAKPIVIVEDDAHKTVYTDMFPLARKYNIPVTVFVYPSAISNAKYAMTWEQIRELRDSKLFDFQSHAYWHPNFMADKKKMKPAEYDKSTTMQLTKAKKRLEKELGTSIDYIAWPFGAYDNDLVNRAVQAGYVSTFTITPHPVTPRDTVLEMPRIMVTDRDRGDKFARLIAQASGGQ